MELLKSFYDKEALSHLGDRVDGRVRRAGYLFSRHLKRVERLLDVGCGAGAPTLHLAQLLSAREVYGVDISRRSAEMAERAGIKAKVIDLNAQPLPYPDGYFQGIFCGEVIEHLFDPDHLLDEVKRCLSADGLCVLTTPNLAAWYNRVALLLGAQPYSADVSFRHPGAGKLVSTTSDAGGAHLRLFTYRALKELLLRHGFRIVDVKGNSLGDCWDTATFSTRLKVIYNVVRPIDSLFAFVPSLSSDVTIALKVGKVRGTA